SLLVLCFFFQAEDGIRDKLVTGVQTCALPILITPRFDELIHAPARLSLAAFLAATGWADFAVLRGSAGLSDSALSKQLTTLADRSEERRVGKEGRARWAREQCKERAQSNDVEV